MVHCGSIRQTASILTMSKDCLRTGDKAIVKFRFINHPEYIKPGQRMVFREGRTKAVGNVLKPLHSATIQSRSSKPSKMQTRGSGQQNQNPNVQQSSTSTTTDPKSSLDSAVLEISTDKRNKSNNRGGKRKRAGQSSNSQSNNVPSTSTGSSSTAVASSASAPIAPPPPSQ